MSHLEILAKLKQALRQGANALLHGLHGTGKSSLALQAAADLGLNLKYYSSSTLDPFVDLVGLPVPRTDNKGARVLDYHRPRDLAEAEVVFFDELSRAHPKVLNAVLEMIQFRTINGEPLPKLRAVVAAINPPDAGYQVMELDPALMDRFHVHLTVTNQPSKEWFEEKFGCRIGLSLYDWWTTDLDARQQASVSPRKLEHIGWLLQLNMQPDLALPPGSKIQFYSLLNRLGQREKVLDIKDFVDDPARFSAEVVKDMNIATRFTHLLSCMKPAQMYAVKDVTLALPAELLTMLQKECSFVLKKTYEAISKYNGAEEAKAFRALLEEKIGVESPGEEPHGRQAAAA